MGKSDGFNLDTLSRQSSNCDLISISGSSIAIASEAEPEPSKGLPEGVKPGEKGDPFRIYRYAKQFCLIGVWVCIVSMGEHVRSTLSRWNKNRGFLPNKLINNPG